MSAPNKSYDPVRAAVLAPAEVERMTAAGLAAIASAASFDDLKAAEVAHRGRQAPLTLASAEIAALPPEAKAEAGGGSASPGRPSTTPWPRGRPNSRSTGTAGCCSMRRRT